MPPAVPNPPSRVKNKNKDKNKNAQQLSSQSLSSSPSLSAMGDYSRSKSNSYSDDRNNMQIEAFGSRAPPAPGPSHGYDLRSYSTSYAASSYLYNNSNYVQQAPREMKLKKAKSNSGGFMGGFMNDPELQRKKRVASYKVYSVEGKVKGSFRKSFRWLKDRYTQVVYGWW